MNEKILLVEDQAIIAMTEAKSLKGYGYEVVIAHNGRKAIEIVDSDPEISLILMDIDLGTGIDGTVTAQEILKARDIPVVFLSGHTEREVVERTEKISSYGYVVKESGIIVLDASIKMAYKLFDSRSRLKRELEKKEQVEKKLLSQEQKLMAWLQQSPICTKIVDSDFNLQFMSDAGFEMLGLDKGNEVYGKPYPFSFFPEDFRRKMSNHLQESKATQTTQFNMGRTNDVTGSEVWLQSSIVPMLDGNDEVDHFIVFSFDITDLKMNEARHTSLLHAIPDMVFLLDSNGTYIDYKRDNSGILSIPPEDFIGKTVAEMLPPRIADQIMHHLRDALREKEIQLFEHEMVLDDTSYYFETRMCAVDDNYVVSIVRDVTEEKRSEYMLQESQEKYQRLVSNSPDMIYRMSLPDGRYEYVSPAVADLFGYEPEEFVDEPKLIRKIIHPHWVEYFNRQWNSLLKGEVPRQYEYQIVTKSGEVRWVNQRNSLYTDDEGSAIAIEGIVSDVTQQKETELQLEEGSKRYQALFDKSFEGIYIHRLDGTIVEVNETACEQTGYTNEELLQLRIFDLHPEDNSTINLSKSEIMESWEQWKPGDKHIVEAEHLRKDGSTFPIKISTGPIVIRDERFIMAITEDISERRHKEDEIKKVLEEKHYLMSELNHRVKNNLNMVSSLISLKDAEIECDLSDLKSRIDVIRSVHERLHQHTEVERIGAKEYFQELLKSVFSSLASQKVDIINTVLDVSLRPRAAVALGIVINEIATNAIKYGFRQDEEARFSVDLKRDSTSEHYILTLSNTGNPFPEEIDFDSPGTLGLQLVDGLVSQLDGTVELRKSPTPVFTIRFPTEEE